MGVNLKLGLVSHPEAAKSTESTFQFSVLINESKGIIRLRSHCKICNDGLTVSLLSGHKLVPNKIISFILEASI